MILRHILFAGAAAIFVVPASTATAFAADDTYMCNGERCYDDQADQTRELNQRSLDQAQRENEGDDDDAMSGPAYGDDDNMYRRDDRGSGAYSRGDQDDRMGDDDDDDDAADRAPDDNDDD